MRRNKTEVSKVSLDLRLFPKLNQSVENAGVAFVKGADERNKFFEKIKL